MDFRWQTPRSLIDSPESLYNKCRRSPGVFARLEIDDILIWVISAYPSIFNRLRNRRRQGGNRVTKEQDPVSSVSIPHRYVTNGRGILGLLLRGRVSIPHRYVTNPPLPSHRSDRSWFQFLIGTLQTFNQSGRQIRIQAVSIPHRYVTNPF